MSIEQSTEISPIVNASCDTIPDINPVVSAVLATILGVLSVCVLVSSSLLACTTLLVGTESSWLAQLRDLATSISGLVVSMQLVSGAFHTAMVRDLQFLQPSVCVSVLGFQLFATTEYYLVSAVQTLLSVRTINNPLRAEERVFKTFSVVSVAGVWAFGIMYFGTQIGILVAQADFKGQLCRQRACSWRIFPKGFLITTIHGIIGPSMLVSGFFMVLLVRLARKHARQIDAQQDAVRSIQIPDSVRSTTAHSSSKTRQINMCLLMYLPWVAIWNLVPSLMLLHTHCPACLSPEWASFVWLLPFGCAVLGSTLKMLNGQKLRLLRNKLRAVYCRCE